MVNRIKNCKLYILQIKYKDITDLILRLQKHIDYLFINNFIDFLQKNHILSNIFLISKKLNLSYNKYIIDNVSNNNDSLSLKLKEILILFENDLNDDIVFEKIYPMINNCKDDIPLINHENEIIDIISDNGLENLEYLIKIYNSRFNLSIKQTELLNEINPIFVPTKIKYFDVSNCNKEYYWRNPTFFNNYDLLHYGPTHYGLTHFISSQFGLMLENFKKILKGDSIFKTELTEIIYSNLLQFTNLPKHSKEKTDEVIEYIYEIYPMIYEEIYAPNFIEWINILSDYIRDRGLSVKLAKHYHYKP
jgi:hypothetical protein